MAAGRLCGNAQNHKTPLHFAAMMDLQVLARVLVWAGADLNAMDKENHMTPLHWAIFYGHERMARLLVEAGADPNAKIKEHHLTPLHLAVMGSLDLYYKLDLRKAEDDLDDYKALDFARNKVREGMVRLLVEAGADPSAGDREHITPLHIAAVEGLEGVARVMLEAGADVNAMDNIEAAGFTPLHCAVMNGQEGTVRLLVEKGADLNAKNKNGKIPIDCAFRLTDSMKEACRQQGK